MEAAELPTTAESTAAYGANPGDGRQVSWHYAADNNSVVQCVRLGDTAWATGNIANDLGISWELAGFATQTRSQWLDTYGVDMLDRVVPIMARDMHTYGIPPRWLTDDQLRAKQRGMTTHNQVRRVFGGTTHTDPGDGFPGDYVLTSITNAFNGVDHLNPEQAAMFDSLAWRVAALETGSDKVTGGNVTGHPMWLVTAIKGLVANSASSTAIAAALASNTAFVDALAKAIVRNFAAG